MAKNSPNSKKSINKPPRKRKPLGRTSIQPKGYFVRALNTIKIGLLALLALLVVSACTPLLSKLLLFGLNQLPAQVNKQSSQQKSAAKYIVVLGGGLTKENDEIVANRYSKLRLQTAIQAQKQLHLPILLSGVESPWMAQWLKTQGVKPALEEGASMNTCENARFTALKLKNKGVNHVVLITDTYHMARARRSFAKQGIYTSSHPASLYNNPQTWDTPMRNLNHSRRAIYEWVANLRDTYFAQSEKDCRISPPTERQKPRGFD